MQYFKVTKNLQKKGGEKLVMKRTNNNEKGITLIALIITIIILVILAAVSVRAIYNMGIVNYAVNGTQDYARGTVEENRILGNTGSFIENALARLRQIQGQDVDESELAEGELALAYRIEEQEDWDGTILTYVVITPKMGGVETYEDYAKKILKDKSEDQIAQIFVDGQNYWNEKDGLGQPTYKDIYELMDYWGENYQNEELKTVEDLCRSYGYPDLGTFAISEWYVEPEGYSDGYTEYATNILSTTTKTREQIFMEGILYKAESEEWSVASELRTAYAEDDLNEFFAIYADDDVTGVTTMSAVVNYANENYWYDEEPYTSGDQLLIYWGMVEPEGFLGFQRVYVECTDTGENYNIQIGDNEWFYIEDNGKYTFSGEAQNGSTATCTVTVKPTMSIAFSQSGEDYTWEDVHEMAKIISGMFAVWGESDSDEVKATKINKLSDSVKFRYPATNTEVTLTVGQEMTLKDTYNNSYIVRILGFNTDKLASTSNVAGDTTYTGTYAGISFEFVSIFKYNNSNTGKRMNEADTNVGGWAVTEMRSDLNGANGVGLLKNKDYIKYVTKIYNTGNQGTATGSCTDRLWLLACSEIWNTGSASNVYGSPDTAGYYGRCNTNESTVTDGITETRYAYYAGQSTPAVYSAPSDITKKPSTELMRWWWLRSPNSPTSSAFEAVNSGRVVLWLRRV